MIMLLVSLLIFVVALAIVYWIWQLVPLPQPWKNIGLAIILLIALLLFLGYFVGWWGPPHWRARL